MHTHSTYKLCILNIQFQDGRLVMSIFKEVDVVFACRVLHLGNTCPLLYIRVHYCEGNVKFIH